MHKAGCAQQVSLACEQLGTSTYPSAACSSHVHQSRHPSWGSLSLLLGICSSPSLLMRLRAQVVECCEQYRNLRSMEFKADLVVGALVLSKGDTNKACDLCLSANMDS